MRSVRARVTLVAIVATLIAVALTAFVLITMLEQSLLEEIDTTITNRASDVADGIDINNELNPASFPTDTETFIGIIQDPLAPEPLLDVHNDDFPDAREVVALLPEKGVTAYDEPFDGAIPSLVFIEGDTNLRMVFTLVESGFEVVVVARSLDGLDRIARLATTMNSMLDRLDSAQDRQRRFASDAAHELRSPLASMAAHLDVDQAHPETADPERTATHLRSELTRLQELVEDLMLLGRSEGGDAGSHRLVDLDDVLDTAFSSIDLDGVDVGRPPPTGIQVRGEPRQLERLFTNLLSNGVRHAHRRIGIAIGNTGPDVVVTVDDDGAGVPAPDQEKIFERFVRLDEARNRDDGGSGLGLALAREIGRQHGGDVTCDASPLGGARFVVRLPAA